MDELVERFETINIPVALACDGNRRKELNMIKRSKGFNWGSGAVSCAYWKGPLLRDVLLAAGVAVKEETARRLWVNFEGADERECSLSHLVSGSRDPLLLDMFRSLESLLFTTRRSNADSKIFQSKRRQICYLYSTRVSPSYFPSTSGHLIRLTQLCHGSDE